MDLNVIFRTRRTFLREDGSGKYLPPKIKCSHSLKVSTFFCGTTADFSVFYWDFMRQTNANQCIILKKL